MFLSMSSGSAADTSESFGVKEIISQDMANFPKYVNKTLNIATLPKYLRLSSVFLHLVCQQTEDVIGGRCAAKAKWKIQSVSCRKALF